MTRITSPSAKRPAHSASVTSVILLVGLSASLSGLKVGGARSDGNFALESTVAFTSNRDHPTVVPRMVGAEIYLMNPDGTNARRLTDNEQADGFPSLSPDGKKIVFDSSRQRLDGEPLNTADLFVMNTDGTEQTPLTRGSSATWSPDSKHIAFHASASGTGLPIKADPGAATEDSDIFVLNVDDFLLGLEEPRNLTRDDTAVDDDPDWSPDGRTVIFTSHDRTDSHANSVTAEIYAMAADGSQSKRRLTFNAEEERAPSWSPDGTRILFMCRRGLPLPGATLQTFELCVMNADGSNEVQLTTNGTAELTPTWSPDGGQIMFHRPVTGRLQLFIMKADGTAYPDGTILKQVSTNTSDDGFANWGLLRVLVRGGIQ